ncbi:SDR family oxidoreductase [Deinococcus frigens]|uniref:SDR family oxidoreductase n=1 Tax=Deinococcus frigens TaxID=249403 RepID=UPI00068C1278|nr:SDR family oxidoreductase [Deinococcus frigens]
MPDLNTSVAPLIGVTGAPGNVGTPLVRELLKRGARVRVLARHPEKAWQAFADAPPSQIEFVMMEFGQRRTYLNAFDGLDKLFVLRPPAVSQVSKAVFPALDVALGAGVRHFALLSIQGADRLPFTPHAQLEKHLGGNGATYTFLRASFFMQNLTTTHLPDLKKGIIAVPAGNGRTSFVDANDVGEAAAIILTEGGHENRAYELTGPDALTYAEVAQIFTRVTGHLYRYTDPNPLTFYRQMRGHGAGRAEVLVMTAIYATARLGLAKHVSDDLPALLGRPAHSIEDFAHTLTGLLQGDHHA